MLIHWLFSICGTETNSPALFVWDCVAEALNCIVTDRHCEEGVYWERNTRTEEQRRKSKARADSGTQLTEQFRDSLIVFFFVFLKQQNQVRFKFFASESNTNMCMKLHLKQIITSVTAEQVK